MIDKLINTDEAYTVRRLSHPIGFDRYRITGPVDDHDEMLGDRWRETTITLWGAKRAIRWRKRKLRRAGIVYQEAAQ